MIIELDLDIVDDIKNNCIKTLNYTKYYKDLFINCLLKKNIKCFLENIIHYVNFLHRFWALIW